MKGYVCPCGKKHAFDVYALAHQHIDLVHTCECGRVNTLRRGLVVRTKEPKRTTLSQARGGG